MTRDKGARRATCVFSLSLGSPGRDLFFFFSVSPRLFSFFRGRTIRGNACPRAAGMRRAAKQVTSSFRTQGNPN